MEFETHSFRMADQLLAETIAWRDIAEVLGGLTLELIESKHLEITTARGTAPAGAQTALNALIDSPEHGLRRIGWDRQVRLFDPPARYEGELVADRRKNLPVEEDPLRAWTMDFKRDRVGVEVSFNHAEATAWQFTKLSIAGESHSVREGGVIDVGVVVTAHSSLKRWGRMDGAVLTFDVCRSWLAQMKRVVPTPILLVGLAAPGNESSAAFRGTSRKPRKTP